MENNLKKLLKSKDEQLLLEVNKLIVTRIKKLRNIKALQIVSDLELGNKVSFQHKGQTMVGSIIKIGRKKLRVQVGDGITKSLWRVPVFAVKLVK